MLVVKLCLLNKENEINAEKKDTKTVKRKLEDKTTTYI